MSFCCDLEKLSLAGLQSTKPYFQVSILLNSKTLKVLDLNGCRGLTLEAVKQIVSHCQELTEINMDNTKLEPESIDFLCNNLTEKIEKLSLFRLKVSDENIKNLLGKCKKISELDLGATSVTENSNQFSNMLNIF